MWNMLWCFAFGHAERVKLRSRGEYLENGVWCERCKRWLIA